MSGAEGGVFTPRLRLVPIGPGNSADFWLVHNDEAVVSCTDRHNRRSRAVMEHIGMRYAGEIGVGSSIEGADDTPLTVCVTLRPEREPAGGDQKRPERARRERVT